MIQELKEIPLKSIFPNTFMFLLSDSLLEIKLKAKVLGTTIIWKSFRKEIVQNNGK